MITELYAKPKDKPKIGNIFENQVDLDRKRGGLSDKIEFETSDDIVGFVGSVECMESAARPSESEEKSVEFEVERELD